jgi:uncharacterized membrane protein YkoI
MEKATLMKMRLFAATVVALITGGLGACSNSSKTDYQKLLGAATFSLPSAIDKALAVKEAQGLIVVNAEIEEENGRIIYSMELANGKKILEINFDVTDGSMLPLETEDHDKSEQAKASKITAKQAIEIATGKVDGKAVEASLLMKEGKPVCDVKVFTPKGKLHTVTLNAVTGEVAMITKEAKKDKAQEAEKEEKEEKKR